MSVCYSANEFRYKSLKEKVLNSTDTVQLPRKFDGSHLRVMRGNVRKGLRAMQRTTKFTQNSREIRAYFAHLSKKSTRELFLA